MKEEAWLSSRELEEEEDWPRPSECRDAEEVALGWEEPVPCPSECTEAEEGALR